MKKDLIKTILTTIFCIIYILTVYLLLFLFFKLIINQTVSIIICLVIFSISLLSFIFFNNKTNQDLFESSKSKNNEFLNKIFDEVKINAGWKNKKILKVESKIFNDNHLLKKVTMNSPAAAFNRNIWIYDGALKSYEEYEIKAMIAHELNHTVSSFLPIIEITERICFLFRIIFYGFLNLFNLCLNISSKHSKKKPVMYFFVILASFFALLAFLIRLPYNLLLAPFHNWEENNCDKFAIDLGYGDGLKHIMKINKPKLNRLFEFLMFPIHPDDYKRLKRINKLSGYDDGLIDYHFNNDVFIEYCGNQKQVTIPSFVTIVGDGKKRCIPDCVENVILQNSVQKINDNAFSRSKIKSITFSSNINYIGSYAFSFCYNLTKINNFLIKTRGDSSFSDSMMVGNNAFLKCNNLKDPSLLLSLNDEECLITDDDCLIIDDNCLYVDETLFSTSILNVKVIYVPLSVKYIYLNNSHIEYIITENKNVKSNYGKVLKNRSELIEEVVDKLSSLKYFSLYFYEACLSRLNNEESIEKIISIYRMFSSVLDSHENELRKVDYHIHFHSQPYSLEVIKEMVKEAKRKKIKELYLLDHTHKFTEFNPIYEYVTHKESKQWCDNKTKISINEYLSFIQEMKQIDFGVKLNFGLEVCYFKEAESLTKELLDKYNFDFTVGSVHFVNGMGYDLNRDFWEGLDVNQFYKDYYKANINLVKSHLFTFLGHPDAIKRFNFLPTIDLKPFYNELADALKEANMETEFNSGLRRYGLDYLGLNEDFLEILKEKRVKIHLSSDAHILKDIGRDFEKIII